MLLSSFSYRIFPCFYYSGNFPIFYQVGSFRYRSGIASRLHIDSGLVIFSNGIDSVLLHFFALSVCYSARGSSIASYRQSDNLSISFSQSSIAIPISAIWLSSKARSSFKDFSSAFNSSRRSILSNSFILFPYSNHVVNIVGVY